MSVGSCERGGQSIHKSRGYEPFSTRLVEAKRSPCFLTVATAAAKPVANSSCSEAEAEEAVTVRAGVVAAAVD